MSMSVKAPKESENNREAPQKATLGGCGRLCGRIVKAGVAGTTVGVGMGCGMSIIFWHHAQTNPNSTRAVDLWCAVTSPFVSGALGLVYGVAIVTLMGIWDLRKRC